MKTAVKSESGLRRAGLLAGMLAATVVLAACGDSSNQSAATAATPPAATAAAAPTPAPVVPGVPTGPLNLSVADLVGQWAPDGASCADTAAIVNISSTAVIRPGGARSTINATAVAQGGLTLQLAQTVNGIRRSEVWRFASTTATLPVLGLEIAVDGGEPVTWVRCAAGVI